MNKEKETQIEENMGKLFDNKEYKDAFFYMVFNKNLDNIMELKNILGNDKFYDFMNDFHYRYYNMSKIEFINMFKEIYIKIKS